MNLSKRLLILLTAFTLQPLCALIVETSSIATIAKHIDSNDKNTLVIFDLDNTCFESAHKHSIGGDQWFTALMAQGKTAGLSEQIAFEKTLHLWRELQPIIPVKPVEDHVVKLIHSLQQNEIPVIALTTRAPRTAPSTINHLATINITFTKSQPVPEKLSFAHLPIPATYQSGILFGGDNKKGAVLKTLIDALPKKPSKIIFIDDKIKYINCVEKTAEELGIPSVSFRYGYLDEKVKTFSLHHAANDDTPDEITLIVKKFIEEHHKTKNG